MSFWLLIRRSLAYHARSHLGVILGAAIGTAALTGALLVGDSVRGSLRDHALERLQGVSYALSSGDRFFRQDLAERLDLTSVSLTNVAGPGGVVQTPGFARTAAFQVLGTVSRQDGGARANRVNILGVNLASWYFVSGEVRGDPVMAERKESGWADQMFAQFGLKAADRDRWLSGELVLVNQELAEQLKVAEGDEVVVRVRKPSLLAQDAVITPREGNSLALRVKVGPILSARLLGNFSLVNQSVAANALLPLDVLSKKLDLAGRANLLLNGPVLIPRSDSDGDNAGSHLPGFVSVANSAKGLSILNGQVAKTWNLEDAQLLVRKIDPLVTTNAGAGEAQPSVVELSSSRIFLDPLVVAAAVKHRTALVSDHAGFTDDTPADVATSGFVTNGVGVLTYLANLISRDDATTPYSMITASGGDLLPPGMRDDEIVVNDWLADDLKAKIGDTLQVSYYVVDSASHLTERTNSFRVREVVAIAGKYADRTLMPEFPGIAKAESTHDWDTGFPLVYKIREKDEAYWKRYRGTPKAFVTLAAGQAMWSNRFGAFTAIRYAVPKSATAEAIRELARKNLVANLQPSELGLQFQPVREQALLAADQSQDFGQLFIGFSLFLVVAALLLMAILFQFSLEQRRSEVGTFLAIGFKPRQVRRLLLGEGLMLALVGGLIGTFLGLGYARAMLWGLTTIWHEAVGNSNLVFHASTLSLIIGLFAGACTGVLTIWITLRKQARQPARDLLAGESSPAKAGTGRLACWTAVLAGVAGLASIGYAVSVRQTTNPEIFFSAGSLLLLAGLAWISGWLSVLERKTSSELTVGQLGVRACARRRTRSVATIALLACGCFVVLSIGVFRLDANQDAQKRSSGTGGFSLIGQASLPIVQDLNTEAGREFFGLDNRGLNGVTVVPFRVREGDEASCLNLNRAQRPRLLGVRAGALAGRFTFTEAAKGLNASSGWELLHPQGTAAPAAMDEVPAIGDANSIQWALGKSVGDTLDYTDERGRVFKLRLVGAVANSILQGSLIIDESEFVKRFPSESGYRFFLLDTPVAALNRVSAELSRALQDQGLELTPAVQRLNEYNAVQNTYLGTFQVLGGLGLLLGSAGLGVVVLRNVFERRGELGLLIAVGFRKRALQWLVLAEHGALLGLGLALGVLSAVIAVLPALLSPAHALPYVSLGITLGAVLLNGLLWTWLATRAALKGDVLSALRNE